MNHQSDLLYKEEVHRIVGCAMEVLNDLGHGFLEKPYEKALVVEFGLQSIPYQQQRRFEMIYKGVEVGKYVPDLICFDRIIVDVKAIQRITNHELGQVINYLRITGLEVGVVLNFSKPRLEWKRVVLQRDRA